MTRTIRRPATPRRPEGDLAVCPHCGRVSARVAGGACPHCGYPLTAVLERRPALPLQKVPASGGAARRLVG